MKKKLNKKRYGITLTETVITAVISVIIVLAVSSLMADSQKGYNKIYEKAFSEVSINSTSARKIFSRIIRQSSKSSGTIISKDSTSLETKYYSAYGDETTNRYAKFYLSDEHLYLETGIVSPKRALTVEKICDDVTDVSFAASGSSAYMHLVVNDQKYNIELNTSAIMNAP